MKPASVKALILGAAGHMGGALSEILDKVGVCSIVVDSAAISRSGVKNRRGKRGFVEGILRFDITKPSVELFDAVAQADVVILAVPLATAEAALRNIKDHLRPGALVVETFSVKSPAAALVDLVPERNEFLGINPLFAPSLCWANRPVLATIHREGAASRKFIAWLKDAGADVATLSASTHDALLARRQGAAHAAIIAFGAVLMAELEATSSVSDGVTAPLSFGPPPYQMMLMVLARVLHGDPHVYAEIQALNTDAIGVRGQLREALTVMDGSVDEVVAAIEAMDHLKECLDPVAEVCSALFQQPLLPNSAADSQI